MINKRITSIIISFCFILMTVMTTPITVGASPTTTNTTTTTTVKKPVTKVVKKPVVKVTPLGIYFLVKPIAKYEVGSKVAFKVNAKTDSKATKIQYSAKLFNIVANKKEMDIVNYGKVFSGKYEMATSFVVKNPGKYRLAVYIKKNGTKGIYNNYHDSYVTYDFEAVKTVVAVDSLVVSVNEKEKYTLPATVSSKVNGSPKQYKVTWDKPANTTTPGAFTFTGTLKDITTSKVINNAKVTLKLTVNAVPVFDSIVDAVDERGQYNLPTTVNGKMSNGTVKEYGVTWDKTVNTNIPGAYTFTGKPKDLSTGVEVNNQNVILTLTIRALPVVDSITASITEGEQYILPTTVNGKMWDGTTKLYNVAWDKPSPEGSTTPGAYTFVGILKDATTAVPVLNVNAKVTLTVNPLALQASVKIESPKSIRIVFNKSVDGNKCNILTSTNGNVIPLVPTWDVDGKGVTLQSQNDFALGTYILKISGIGLSTDTYSLDVKAPYLTNISVPQYFVVQGSSAAKIMLVGTDQYGQKIDVISSEYMWMVNDTTAQIALQASTNDFNYITVQTNLTGIKAGDKISVFCKKILNTSIEATASLEINTKTIDSITLGQPILPKEDNKLSVKGIATSYEIPYNAVQNYLVSGNTVQTLAFIDDKVETSLSVPVTIGNIVFVTDKPDVLSSIKIENGKIFVKIAPNMSGVVKLTASAIPTTGQTTTQNIFPLVMNILAPGSPDSLTRGTISNVLAAGGSEGKLPVIISDQYGEVMAPDAFVRSNFSDFMITSSAPTIATAAFGKDGKTLDITPIAVGNANITIVNKNSGKALIYPVVVNPAAIVKSFTPNIDYNYVTRGAIANLKIDAIDQYANIFTNVAGTYKYAITPANGSANVAVSANNVPIDIMAKAGVTLTGVTSGKRETITLTLYNDANKNNIIDANELVSISAMEINVVADNEQLVYFAKPSNNIYAAVAQDRSNTGLTQDAYGAIQNQNNRNELYAEQITLMATKLDGTPVAIVGNPITAIIPTTNSTLIDYAGKIGTGFGVIGRQWSGSEVTKEAEIQVTYTDNTGAVKNLDTKVTISKESLKAMKIRFMANVVMDADVTNDTEIQDDTILIPAVQFDSLSGKKLIENQNLVGIPGYFEVDDQYGVSSFNPVSFSVTGKQSIFGVFTIEANGVISTSRFVTGDSVTISAVDTEGHTLLVTLKAQ